jgi:hypothetical protein
MHQPHSSSIAYLSLCPLHAQCRCVSSLVLLFYISPVYEGHAAPQVTPSHARCRGVMPIPFLMFNICPSPWGAMASCTPADMHLAVSSLWDAEEINKNVEQESDWEGTAQCEYAEILRDVHCKQDCRPATTLTKHATVALQLADVTGQCSRQVESGTDWR